MSGKIQCFYRFPDLDSRIGVHLNGNVLEIAFLAKGNAYKGKGADRKLYKRNPDRTQALDRLLPVLASLFEIVAVRVGKTANEPDYASTLHEARKAYSKGGNFRFDVLLDLGALGGSFPCEAHGLVPCENRPVPLAFV